MSNEDIPLSPGLLRAQYLESRKIRAEHLLSLTYGKASDADKALLAAHRACARLILLGVFQ